MWSRLYGMLYVCSQHRTAQSVWVDSISAIERSAVPEQIEVIDKSEVMDFAGGLEPTMSQRRSGRWDMVGRGPLIKTDFPQRFKEKRSLKSHFVNSVCRRAISL